MSARRLRLGLLLSGGGRTALNIHERIANGSLNADIAVVVSSRGNAKGVEGLRACGYRVVVAERKELAARDFQSAITKAVEGADLICMCGFLSLWTIPNHFDGRVMNIHPALLPAFGGPGMYGRRVHEAVLASGAVVSGCTVHYCDNEYDHGPIILQRIVPVLAGDTPESLGARVFTAECDVYPRAIRMFASRRTG